MEQEAELLTFICIGTKAGAAAYPVLLFACTGVNSGGVTLDWSAYGWQMQNQFKNKTAATDDTSRNY